MIESNFQKAVREEIERRFPDAIVLKNDPNYIQGIPDLLVLYNDRWAALEVKKNKTATHRPNQDYYVDKMNDMSFAAFIFPENKEEVLNAMEQSFQRRTRRKSRVSRSK
jgi:hypothetical protein